jgi:WD40 repeat protein
VVSSVAFSADGKRILTGSEDGTARVWDAEKGHELRALKGHTHHVSSVAFSPDGKRILTGSRDTTAKVWDAETGQELLTLKGHTNAVTGVAFSPDGKRLFAWDQTGKLLVWSLADRKPAQPHERPILPRPPPRDRPMASSSPHPMVPASPFSTCAGQRTTPGPCPTGPSACATTGNRQPSPRSTSSTSLLLSTSAGSSSTSPTAPTSNADGTRR